MSRWTRESIVEILTDVYQSQGYCTSYQWMKEHRSPHFYTIIHFFGSWHAAWQAAGYEAPLRLAPKDHVVTRELVIRAMQNVGHFESERIWSTNHRTPSAPSIRKIFGSWQEAWEAAGLWEAPMSPEARIIARLREAGTYYSETYWDRMGFRPVAQTIRNHFGTWSNAWQSAGITPVPVRTRWSIEQVTEKLRVEGQYCSAREWDSRGYSPTSRTIRKLFGSWKAAWAHANVSYPDSRATVTREMVIDALTHYGEYVSAQYWDASGQKPSSHTVRKLFGSWAEAWAAAGLHAGRAGTSIVTTNDAPTHPLNDLDAQLWEERQHGQTLESLSERFGLSTSTIARRILRARVPSGGSRPTG